MFNATLKVKNTAELSELLDRTKIAIKELENCLWELKGIGIEVEITTDKKEAASGN